MTQTWQAPYADHPVRTTVRLPGSKSATARALVLSALSDGTSTLSHPLRARDTELMAAGLRAMGASLSTMDTDGTDATWRVTPADRLRGPASIDVGLAGTVMRFLPPLAGLAVGSIAFDGDEAARRRPIAPLLGALSELGVALEASPSGGLPFTVHGAGHIRGGTVVIDASTSSQLISALLLAAPRFERGLTVHHQGPPVPSQPHLRMTAQMLREAGATVDDEHPDVWRVEPGPLRARTWRIEPDLSGAAPFLAAAMVTAGEVTVAGWPRSTTQPGDQLRGLLTEMGATVSFDDDGLTLRGAGIVHGIDADLHDVSELTPVIAALAALADSPSRLRGVAHIRAHETDRIAALVRELGHLGADVTEHDDGLDIRPRPLRGTLLETYADHRMAHAWAVIGLAVPGVVLSDVACTSKTMPEFPALWTELVDGITV